MSAEYFRPQVVKMLGNYSPEEFIQLPQSRRSNILEKSQVKNRKIPVIIGDSDIEDNKMEDISILRQRDLVGDGPVGKQIFAEAVQTYYDHNSFSVDSHWLVGQGAGRLRNLNVRLWLEHPDDAPTQAGRAKGVEAEEDYDLNFWNSAGQELPKAVQDLRRLFSLSLPGTLLIEVVGGGAQNSSDLNTQLKVQEISRVVKRLMNKFGTSKRVKVEKVVHIGDDCQPGHSITAWWSVPTQAEKQQFMQGLASFDTTMRIQMEEWTLVHEKVAGPQATRPFLP